ncbi:MAG: S41 family peptidase [Pyrinomonadaceae bacterium]
MRRFQMIFNPGKILILSSLILMGTGLIVRAQTASESANTKVFNDVWQTINDSYYDPKFNNVDWEGQRREFASFAAHARNDKELYTIIRRMIGRLRDSHTRVYRAQEKFDWKAPEFVSTGILIREVEGEPIILHVERGSDAYREGLRDGDVILSVDGQNALEIFKHKLSEINSSTSAAGRLAAMAQLLDGERDTFAEIVVKDNAERIRVAHVRRTLQQHTYKINLQRINSIGLITFDAFTEKTALAFIRALKGSLRNTNGLIIDLRSNGGGEAEAMTDITSAFLPVDTRIGRFMDRSGLPQLELRTRTVMVSAADEITSYNKPVIILTGVRTSSAAEIFTYALQHAGRA